MEFEMIKDVVKATNTWSKGKYSEPIEHWLETDNKTLKFMCANAKEKKNCRTAVGSYCSNHKYDFTIFCERGTNNVYLVRS